MYLKLRKMSALFGALVFSGSVMAVPISTDIVTVVDESGSMSNEQAWLPGMINNLDAQLALAAGADPFSVQYGVVGFGRSYPSSLELGNPIDMDSGASGFQEWGNATQYGTAAGDLVTSGGTEDGYAGLDTANGYTGQSGALRNYILVTDEDRDNETPHTFASMEASLAAEGALLNAVLDVSILCGDGRTALGLNADNVGYIADESGSFSTCVDAFMTGGDGSSISDYGNLALGTGGAVWDLNQLRLGGDIATSFTSAFVDVKVEETTDRVTTVPEPASLLLLSLGLMGLGASRRYRR